MTTSEILMICLTAVVATAGVIGAVIFNNQLTVMQGQLDEMRSAGEHTKKAADAAKQSADAAVSAFNLAKRPELTTSFDSWVIQRFGADQSPIITFEIMNAGNSHAHILRARYDYAIAKNAPEKFDFSGTIEGAPALLGPNSKSGPIIISGLPSIKSDVYKSIDAGNSFLFLRATIFYQDVFTNIVEIRVTGRYGRSINSKGEREFRFLFSDADVPSSQWWTNFKQVRRLNFIEGVDPKDRPSE